MNKKYLIPQLLATFFYTLVLHWELTQKVPICCIVLTLYVGLVFLLLIQGSCFFFQQKIIKDKQQGEILRAFRHDFMNHLQVIYSFLQLRKTDKACEYIKGITEKI